MSLTMEQVNTLRVGDVVELSHTSWPEGTVVKGPLYERGDKRLYVASFCVRWAMNDPMEGLGDTWTVTLIERARPPLYVNHIRTRPVDGDVAREEGHTGRYTYTFAGAGWYGTNSRSRVAGADSFRNLRLLVDGVTGEVVR